MLFSLSSYHHCNLISINHCEINLLMGKTTQQTQTSHKYTLVRIKEVSGYLPERYSLPHGYTATPSQQEIFSNNGKCANLKIVSPFGEARWEGTIDISTLLHPLCHTFRMAASEIEVYQSNCGTPARGFELNRPCFVTFKARGNQDTAQLRRICQSYDAKLIDHDLNAANFTVLVLHFTKYNFNDNDSTEKKAKTRSETPRSASTIQPSNAQVPAKLNNNSQPPFAKQPPIFFKQNSIQQFGEQHAFPSIFSNFKMEVEKRQSQTEGKEENSPQTHIPENPVFSIMNAISRKQEAETATRVQDKVFEKICNLIDSDKIYYNKEIKSSEPATREQLLYNQNIQREKCMLDTLQCEDFHRIRFAQTLVGCGNIVTCQRFECDSQPFAEVIKLKQAQQTETVPVSTEHSFFGLITQNTDLTPLFIAKICNNQEYPLSVRRFLSLYSILFQDEVWLAIGRNAALQYKMKMLDNSRRNNDEARMELFKNWLAWVSNAQFTPRFKKGDQLFLFDTKLSTALALRKPEEVIDFLYVNNRWDDAQVIINIEDAAFRTYHSSLKTFLLAPELEDLLSQNVKKLSKSINHWFILMAFAVWYFKKQAPLENLLSVIEVITPDQVNCFQEEFRLLQIFLAKSGRKLQKSVLFTPPNDTLTSEKLSCFYLISNNLELAKFEQSLISNSKDLRLKEHLYAMYRYQLVSRLAKMHAGNQQVKALIQNDGFISKAEKDSFQRKYFCSVISDETNEEGVLNKANQLISKGQILPALALLFALQKWSDQVFEKVCHLVTLPHLLANYKKSINQSLQNLLEQRGGLFADLLLILTAGRQEALCCQQVVRLIDILLGKSRFSKYLTPTVQSFVRKEVERKILQAIVLRNELMDHISKNDEVKQAISQLFKERVSLFKKMEETAATF